MITQEFRDRIQEEFKHLSIYLEEKQLLQFNKYYELMIEWNQKINLTAITELNEVITKHFVDSLTLIKAVGDIRDKKYQVIDIGTGAGFPGIPLKIVFPQLNITLMDSLNKRVNFLNTVVEILELGQLEVVHSRAEDLGRNQEYREKYDIAVSRAVAHLSVLAEYCMPFVKKGGMFVSYKSGKVEQELLEAENSIRLLSGKIHGVEKFILPGSEAERVLVKVYKMNSISGKYPRKAGVPSKNPL